MNETTAVLFGQNESKPKDSNARDELQLKIIDEVFSNKDIEVKTDLNTAQIIAFSKGKVFANEFNCDVMSDFVNLISTYSISKNRKSRKEFTDISKALNSMGLDDEESQKISDRLLGR
jgi:hypothetical protein